MNKETDGWISVEDGLPDKLKPVIVGAKIGNRYITCQDTGYYDGKRWIDNSNDIPLVAGFITHWQPLPAPPNKSK